MISKYTRDRLAPLKFTSRRKARSEKNKIHLVSHYFIHKRHSILNPLSQTFTQGNITTPITSTSPPLASTTRRFLQYLGPTFRVDLSAVQLFLCLKIPSRNSRAGAKSHCSTSRKICALSIKLQNSKDNISGKEVYLLLSCSLDLSIFRCEQHLYTT
jgi:hypothetical protein